MRHHLARLLVVLALLGGVASFDAGTDAARADGATIVEVGWWSRTPGTTTPEGGFQVASTPEGEASVAAVRVQVDGELSSALLILFEAVGGYLEDGAVIHACPTTSTWTAADGGPLEEAPQSDCASKVTLTRDGTIGSWTGDIRPLLEGATGPVSIVLKPGVVTTVAVPTTVPALPPPVPPLPVPAAPPAPVPVPTVPTPVDPGFRVEFSRAQMADAGGGVSDAPSPSPSSSGTGSIATGGSGSFDSGFAPTFAPSDSFASSPSASLTPSRSALPAATAEVSAGGAGGAGTAAAVESGLQPVAATRGPAAPWGRLLLLIPLSALVGAAGSFARRNLLGRSGDALAAG